MKKSDNRQKFVVFIDNDTKAAFDKLNTGKFEEKQLYEFINRAIDDLKKDEEAGIHLPKNKWPKEYIQKFGIQNLWKYDLPNGWRLIYTIKGTEIQVLSVLLEWFEHKDYERKFGYKRS